MESSSAYGLAAMKPSVDYAQVLKSSRLVSSRRSQRRFGAAPGSHKWRYQKLSGGPIPSRRQTGS
jgi:hypothetical protein